VSGHVSHRSPQPLSIHTKRRANQKAHRAGRVVNEA
jgi:hypothetical protein